MDKKKVYMLASSYGGCYAVRQFLPMKYNGWTGDFLQLGIDRDKREKAREMMESDIIVAHRMDDPAKIKVVEMLRGLGKKIVVDNDDTSIIDEIGNLAKLNRYQENVHGSISRADLVTCSTDFLKEEYSQYTKAPIVVLPNCVDPNDYPQRHGGIRTRQIRIGFIGSVMYRDDRRAIQDLIIELSRRKDVKVICYGLIPPKSRINNKKNAYLATKEDCDFWDTIDCEWHGSTPVHEYIETVNNLNLDIAVIARRDNYFNRCKSNLKYLEMSMLNVPCVCQSFRDGKSPYDKDIIDGWNGYLAEDEDEFRNRIEELIRFPDLRKKIRHNAKKYVLDNYDIKTKAHLWAEAYKLIQ
jgi:O-antigen biosynthesis protein